MKSSIIAASVAVIIYASFTWLRHWMDDQARELNTPTPIARTQAAQQAAKGLASPSFEDASFCFFVYAPIFEVGRDHNHAGLFMFGQTRISWFGGFFAANKSNPEFMRAFGGNTEKHKRVGNVIEKKLLTALATNDPVPFGEAIAEAVWCDRKIGIKTKWLPTLPRPGIPQ